MAASFTAACRVSARLAGTRVSGRAISTSSRCLAAQNFTMPALSPTMTEGNIAAWKVKEGESFSAGDVLLEIETDKATMDVEAQDDGILMKIMQKGGSKAIQVGSRIAVVAEAGDDISSLEIPPDQQQQQQEPDQAAKQKQAAEQDKEDLRQSPKNMDNSSSSEKTSSSSSSKQGQRGNASKEGGNYEHKYPLLPSVGHLLKQHNIPEAELVKIKPTGPGGRLLKGDVLAYMGSIDSQVPATISSRFEKLSHLDLSNIKTAPSKSTEAPPSDSRAENALTPGATAAAEVDKLEIQVPVSFAKVIQVQRKIQDTLGVFLPMSTFIHRATEVANDDLPPAARAPTANELFEQVLGLDKIKGGARGSSRGVYLPQIAAIPPASLLRASTPKPRKTDIFDELAPRKSSKKKQTAAGGRGEGDDFVIPTIPGLSNDTNVFSLLVPKAEEERAQLFLERCRVILEEEPGRLVL